MPDGAGAVDVSVVVCTYNRAASLGHTLRALDAQVTPPGLAWELVLVDNNSTDSTRAAIEAFATASRIPIRAVFEARQGLSHARNTGLAHARGAIVAFTDDDVRPDPDWVASVAAAMRETGAQIVGGRILPLWEAPPPPWILARPGLGWVFSIMDHPEPAPVADAGRVPGVWGANMAFRREVFARVGAFDHRLGMRGDKLYRGEELDLVRRALEAGFRAAYDPRLVVWHRVPRDRMRRRYVSRLHFQQAEGWGARRAPAGGRRLFGAPLYMYRQAAGLLAGWLWAAVRRRPDALDRWLAGCELAGDIWGRCRRHLRTPPSGA
jgi:glycosyltransferase involved in cell wall biosynthesis